MSLSSKLRHAFEIWKLRGAGGIRARIEWNRKSAADKTAYTRWLKIKGTPNEQTRAEMKRQITRLAHRPLISILLPVYNVDEKWLRLCLDSVIAQIYDNWELCIADDHSPDAHIRRVLDEYAATDARFKVIYRPANGHISAASNSALELAEGQYCVLLDHDDELSPDALFWVANELNAYPETAMIYSDEDMIDTAGVRSNPKFKPDFSRDLLYSLNLVTHLSAYRTELLRSIGGFRIGLEGSQDYDLALRVVERIDERQIRHIPRILYHWRAIAGSVALHSDEKPYAHERARAAIKEHFERTGVAASVKRTHHNLHRVRYEIPGTWPTVMIIIDGLVSRESQLDLMAKTDYPSFDTVLLAANETPILPVGYRPTSNECAERGRAARLNNAVRESESEIIVFLNGAVEPTDPDWLRELVSFTIQKNIGAAGGRLLFADETVCTAGLIVGAGDGVADAHGGFPADVGGNMGRNLLTGNFSAVSVAFMSIRRKDFESIGGFDAVSFPNALFDADLCLRLIAIGKRIVVTPNSELIKTQPNISQAISAGELLAFKKRWPVQMASDPFYNSNLSKRDGSFSIDI